MTNPTDSGAEPLAIIGIGCRFPGGGDSPEAFWEMLRRGTDAIVEVPADRWDARRFHDPDPAMPGKTLIRHAAFLTAPLHDFDALFFGMSPREAACLDPQQRLLMELVWEAFEDAGVVAATLLGTDTGVYVGGFTLDSLVQQFDSTNHDLIGPHTATGVSLGMLANRISYSFDLRGPSVTMDTACSSSLVAFHFACQDLWQGRCSLALVGGVNVMANPSFPIAMSKGNFLAADGRCKTFDARADGYGRGEGAGVVVLKPLSRALADGDTIRALVRATGVGQDGRTKGITVPNGEAQESLMRSVYRQAGVAPRELAYVEAHGTGTAVGDLTEVTALGHVIGRERPPGDPCVMGSVKTNIGHLEAAAGIAGVIKATLCLQHGEIPPHLNPFTPNPAIPFEALNMRPPRGVEPLPAGRSAGGAPYVGINSFGYGGTNAHALLQGAAAADSATPQGADGLARLAPVSARSAGALRDLARAYRDRLRGPDPASLRDLCYSMSLHRDHHDHRLAVVGDTHEEVAAALDAFLADEPADALSASHVSAEPPRPVFVFTGMGPQWWGMGRELWRDEPVFRQAAEEADRAFHRHAGWSILEQMLADEASSRMRENQVAQPANFVLQVGLAALWRSWGVEPAAVVGHSVGEVAAAFVAGALGLDDAAKVSFHRSRLQQKMAGGGGMLAVDLPAAEAEALVAPYAGRVGIAASNGPSAVTLAGDPGPLEEIAAALAARGVFHRALNVEVAYHSPQMDPLQGELLEVLEGVRPRPATVPVYSTVTGRQAAAATHDAGYWWRNVRETVRFTETVETMLDDGFRLFVEIGPHPVVASSIKASLARRGPAGLTVASLDRKKPERAQLLGSLGALYCLGAGVDWRGVCLHGGRFAPLPRYPWQRETCTWQPEAAPGARFGATGSALPGDRSPTPQPSWEVELTSGLLPYLRDHVVQGAVVLPGAAYVDAALSAQWKASNGSASVLEEVRFHRALVVGEHEKATLRVEIDERSRSVSLYSRTSGRTADWTLHTTARLSGRQPSPAPSVDFAAVRERCGEAIAPEDLYARLHATGLQLGPTFRGIRSLWRRPGEVLAEIALHPSLTSDLPHSRLYPTVLDCAFQALVAAVDADLHARSGVFVPVEIARVASHAPLGERVWSHVLMTGCSAAEITGNVVICDEAGAVLAEIRGLTCRSLAAGKAARADAGLLAQSLYAFHWEESAPPSADSEQNGGWLILADHGGVGEALARELRGRGAPCLAAERGAAFGVHEPDRVVVRDDHPEDLAAALQLAGRAPLRGVVYLWDLDAVAVERTADWTGPLHLVQALAAAGISPAPRLYLVTRGVHLLGDDLAGSVALAQAPLWGLGRVVMNEHPELACTLVDLPPDGPLETVALATELLAGSAEEEVVLRGTRRFVHRLRRERLPEAVAAAPVRRPGSHPFAVEITTPGSTGELRLRESERRPPGPGEVELRIRATALNFKDVLKVLGLLSEAVLDGTYYGHQIGMEAAATVVRVGAGVEEMKPGDEIVGTVKGSFRSYVTVPVRELCWVPKLREHGDAEQAAMPVAFVTALYSLCEVGRLRRGERVLVHSAAGGVGLAAIQVARWCGAEVFATAGSTRKREYLRSLGIEHVMDSRSLDFADQVMAATGGAGVDVVLNFLTGEGLTKSLSVLAPFGRFVEIGKQDIDRDQPLGLKPFNDNLTFSSVDIDRLLVQRPDVAQRTLTEAWRGLADGHFQPLPLSIHPIGRVEEAFREMMQASHIGKIALTLDEVELELLPLDREPPLLHADASYLITGGLGGFGLAVARWMVDEGARNLVLAGRAGAASPEARAAVRALEETGARILARPVDIVDRAQLAALLDEVAGTMPPLRGVMHAAMVLDDGMLVDQSAESFHRVLAPKVQGAWNLDGLTAGLPLDFFVLFSSISALVGNPGQVNYAAANAFLDALAHRRRGRGQPALSVNWGVLADVGVAARTAGLTERLERIGLRPIPPAQAVEALGQMLRAQLTQVSMVDADWQKWGQSHPAAARSPRFSQLLEAGAAAAQDPLRRLARSLAALSVEERAAEATQLVATEIARVLRMPVAKLDLHQPLAELGVDSLLAVELQQAIQQGFGVEYSVLELLKGMTVAELAAQVLARMDLPESTAAAGGLLDAGPAPSTPVDELTEEQVDEMLIELLQAATSGDETPWMP